MRSLSKHRRPDVSRTTCRHLALRWLGLAALVALAGCRHYTKPEPVPFGCNAIVYATCTVDGSTKDTGVRWTGDATKPGAWDLLVQQAVGPLATKLLTCEAKRQAAVACLRRLDENGVIKLAEPQP